MQIADKELPKSRRQQRLEKNAPRNDEYIAPLQENALKRKREQVEQEQDPKLKEFLQVYQAPSKTNIWTNGDTQMGGPVAAVEEPVPAVDVPEDESDDDYQVIAKKPKTAVEPAEPETKSVSTSDKSATNKTQDVIAEPGDELEGVQQETAADLGPVSDADWLRSRTNRVLDFIEDDEEPAKAVPSLQPENEQPPSPEVTEQPAEAEQPIAQESEVPTSSEVEKIRDTGRLYLRNLHFEVTEEEIREHFSKYGSLEEVSLQDFLSCYACNDEHPR